MFNLSYLKDERYITIDGKPVLVIYRPDIIERYDEMILYWRKLATKNGLTGLYIIAQGAEYCIKKHVVDIEDETDACIMFEPLYTFSSVRPQKCFKLFINNIFEFYQFVIKWLVLSVTRKIVNKFAKRDLILDKYSYKMLCRTIMKHKICKNFYPGMFVSWDNTARRGSKARIVVGSTPELFKEFFTKQILRTRNEYKKDYIFFTAWNEWAEGSYLEPNKKFGFKYLEAIKDVLLENDEWPFE